MDRARDLERLLTGRAARVAVIGAGYVGLSAALAAARAGFHVTALDVDAHRVQMLQAGGSYIRDVSPAEVAALVQAGQLAATTDYSSAAAADVILICVPTPLTPNRVPDLSCVAAATREVAARLQPGQLICLESTTYPGTTEELVLPALAAGGLQVGRDFFLAYCPERIDPGNPAAQPERLVRVLAGVTPACLALASTFYGPLAHAVVPVSSTRTAELTKLFENTYRAVNIALVNELALLCDRMGQDVWEVVAAAASKPFGIQSFHPGPGVGGHCIPLDPHYLAWKAREYDFTVRFVELAAEINSAMPYFVVAKLTRLLSDQGKPLRGARILVLGVAYKRDVADARESPALRIIDLLAQAAARVLYHDPLIPELPATEVAPETRRSVDLTPELLADLDAAVVVTDHSQVDYQAIADQVPLLLDTRGATRGVTDARGSIRRL